MKEIVFIVKYEFMLAFYLKSFILKFNIVHLISTNIVGTYNFSVSNHL